MDDDFKKHTVETTEYMIKMPHITSSLDTFRHIDGSERDRGAAALAVLPSTADLLTMVAVMIAVFAFHFDLVLVVYFEIKVPNGRIEIFARNEMARKLTSLEGEETNK